MQSVRFIELLNDIYKRLFIAELVKLLRPVVEVPVTTPNFNLNGPRASFNETIFRARDNLAFLNQDDETKAMLSSMGLLEAFDAQLIGRLLVIFQTKPSRDDLHKSTHDFSELMNFFATLKAVQRLKNSMVSLISEPRMSGLAPGEMSIEFEVLDLGAKSFDLERIETILPLIDDLFQQLCRVYEIEPASPKIMYMDSGSGLIIGLKGADKVITAIQSLFLTFWEKIRFQKFDEIDRKLETIGSSLDVLEKINVRRTSGSITEEDAKRLSHLITNDVLQLFENGASLREIQKAETIENRKLLTDKVTVKLLTNRDEGGDAPSLHIPNKA